MKPKRHQIRYEDIVWFEGDSNYTNIFYTDGTQFLSGYTISFFEKKLLDFEDFLRIHKSVIINKNFLQSFELEGRNGFVKLTNGHRFWVARRRKQEVINAFNES